MMAIHLGRPLPNASRDPPGRRRGNPPAGRNRPCHPYLVLLPVGFTVPPPLPATRCALTAPFHPYRRAEAPAGGLLSVALSLGSPPPAVNRHRVSVEPGLSSPGAAKPHRRRPSGRLTAFRVNLREARSRAGEPSGTNVSRKIDRRYRTQSSSSPFNSRAVSKSMRPLTRAGRKCRWKAWRVWNRFPVS